jgi:pilus assembly protein CpaB
MISRRGPVLLAVAVLLGATAAVIGYNTLRSLAERAEKGRDGELRDMVVVVTDLSYGVKLEPALLKVVRVPKDALPAGAIGSVDSVKGQVTKVFMSAREPVTALKLSSRGGGLSLLIRPNMRAASIEVNQVSGVSGFVLPGDRVDVLTTIDPRRDGQDVITRTLLQSVEVLAAGQKTTQNENKPLTVQAVTLLVDPRGAEMLAHAQHQGELHLVLRNPEDQSHNEVASFTTREMIGSSPITVAPAVAPTPVRAASSRTRVRTVVVQAPPPTTPERIRIIRSADVQETPAVVDSARH